MAKFNFDIDKGLFDQLKQLENPDAIATKMLESAGPILERGIKAGVAKHRRTGSMEASIKAKKPTKTKNGYSITVRPTGRDDKGVSNMEKLVYLEHGTSKQKATPVLKAALASVEKEAMSKMQETFDREVGG